jgi:hypothetical protein
VLELVLCVFVSVALAASAVVDAVELAASVVAEAASVVAVLEVVVVLVAGADSVV